MNHKQNLILKFLKRKERVSTSEMAIRIKSNFWVAEQYLEALEKENKIEREIFGNSTFWKLK